MNEKMIKDIIIAFIRSTLELYSILAWNPHMKKTY